MKNLIKNLIKKRTAKKSDRGIYLQDQELTNTNFKVGTKFKYIVDVNNNKVIITPSDNSQDNTVSKRKSKHGEKPVIDIRNQKALEIFKDSDFLQIEIYNDQVLVEGFSNSVNEISVQKTKSKINNLTDIRQILKVKKQAEVRFTKNELKMAVGSESYDQLSFTDFFESENTLSKQVSHIHSALKNIHIPMQVISLFSGAGLFDLAFKKQGFDIIFALEKDENIAKTYRQNLGEIVTTDIKNFDKTKFPFAPIVIGGSPCKGFSNSNRYSNFLDNPNNLLVREYIESVKQINPYIFVLENVPQILTAGGGKFFNEIKNELSNYEITKGVISSASYGDPQERKRAFIIGSRLGEKIQLPKPKLFEGQFKTVRDAFRNLTSFLPNQNNISIPKDITLERIKHVKPGGNIFDIPEEIRPKGKHSDMYKRLEWDKPSITIVNPRKAMLLHPIKNRILSIREACRLFSLPDNFIFKGTLSSMQESIANGIPLKMGQAIAETIKNVLTKYNIRNRLVTK